MSLKIKISKRYRSLFTLNHRLRKFCRGIIQSNTNIDSLKDGVACFCLAKAYKTHGIVIRLAKAGYTEDAEMLTRTLFDLALIISASLKDKTDNTALKFLRFDYPLRSKMFKQLQDEGKFRDYFEQRQKNPKPGDESIEEIQVKSERWLKQYGGDFNRKWHSGLTTGELAKSVELEKYFNTAYNLQTQLSHSWPRVINRYLTNLAGAIKIDVNPKEKDVDVVLVSVFNMLIIILDKANDQLKILDEKLIKNLVDDWILAARQNFV